MNLVGKRKFELETFFEGRVRGKLNLFSPCDAFSSCCLFLTCHFGTLGTEFSLKSLKATQSSYPSVPASSSSFFLPLPSRPSSLPPSLFSFLPPPSLHPSLLPSLLSAFTNSPCFNHCIRLGIRCISKAIWDHGFDIGYCLVNWKIT